MFVKFEWNLLKNISFIKIGPVTLKICGVKKVMNQWKFTNRPEWVVFGFLKYVFFVGILIYLVNLRYWFGDFENYITIVIIIFVL